MLTGFVEGAAGDGVLWCTGTECWLWRWFGHSPVWVSKPHILFPASVSGRTFWTLTRRTLLPLVSDLRERRLCTVRRVLRCRGKVGPLALLGRAGIRWRPTLWGSR